MRTATRAFSVEANSFTTRDLGKAIDRLSHDGDPPLKHGTSPTEPARTVTLEQSQEMQEISNSSGNGNHFAEGGGQHSITRVEVVEEVITGDARVAAVNGNDGTREGRVESTAHVTHDWSRTNIECHERLLMLEDRCVEMVSALKETTAQLKTQKDAVSLVEDIEDTTLRDEVADLGTRRPRMSDGSPSVGASSNISLVEGLEGGDKFKLDEVPILHPEQAERLKTYGKLDSCGARPETSRRCCCSSNPKATPEGSDQDHSTRSSGSTDQAHGTLQGGNIRPTLEQLDPCLEVSTTFPPPGGKFIQQPLQHAVCEHATRTGREGQLPLPVIIRTACDSFHDYSGCSHSVADIPIARQIADIQVEASSPAARDTVSQEVRRADIPGLTMGETVGCSWSVAGSQEKYICRRTPDTDRTKALGDSSSSERGSLFLKDIFYCNACESNTCHGSRAEFASPGAGDPPDQNPCVEVAVRDYASSDGSSSRTLRQISLTEEGEMEMLGGQGNTLVAWRDQDLPVFAGRDEDEGHSETCINTLNINVNSGKRNPSEVIVENTAFFEPFNKRENFYGGLPRGMAYVGDDAQVSRERSKSVFVYDEEELSREMIATRVLDAERDDEHEHNERITTPDVATKEMPMKCAAETIGRLAAMKARRDSQDNERRRVLENHGVGFLHDAAELERSVFRIRSRTASGGCSVIRSLKLRSHVHQQAVDVFTEGSGLVVKVVAKNAPKFQKEAMRRELAIVKSLVPGCHPNVVDYLSYSVDNLTVVMKAESCDLQDLLGLKFPLEAMGRGERLRFFAGGIRGLVFLHSCRGFTHMDVKPANFMVNKDMSRLKIADLGFAGRSREERSMGGTKEYMAPETMAHHRNPGTPRALLDPSMDTWAVGIMLLQVLFVQELPRTDPNEIVIHGLMPKQEPFLTSLWNVEFLTAKAEQTGLADDQMRMAEAESVHNMLLTDYAMQQVKMQDDLTASLLCRGKWEEPGGLRFQEEVTRVLLSLLDPNPLQRLPLPELVPLLECENLWAKASDDVETLPASVQGNLENLDRLIPGAEHASRGVWWQSNPWWINPPVIPVIPQLSGRDPLLYGPVSRPDSEALCSAVTRWAGSSRSCGEDT